MFKTSKLCAAVAVLGSALGAAGAAHAATYINTGDLSISFDYFDSGTIYSVAAPGTLCNSALSCDGAAASATYGQGTVVVGGNNIKTDTQGIFRINTITNTLTNTSLYDISDGLYVLSGIFSGLYDIQVTVDASGNTSTRAGGGVLEIFKNTFNNANKQLVNLSGQGAGSAGDPNRDLTAMKYTNTSTGGTISGGALWLKANFSESVIVDGSSPNATFQSTWATGTNASGTSSGFLDIDTAAGGEGVGWFERGTMQDALGNAHDLYYSSSFNIVNTLANPPSQQWNIRNNTGQVVANPTPEPASIALVGLALLGMGAVAKRRIKK